MVNTCYIFFTATVQHQQQHRGRGLRRRVRGVRGIQAPRNVDENSMLSSGGVLWKSASENEPGQAGRRARHNILTEQSGPTPYARRQIGDKFITAWKLLVDDNILRHIKTCTETEAHRVLGHSNWSITLQELDKFISILYARGAYDAKNISVNDLWSKTWGIAFFSKTMSRDRFKEIMKYLRFDLRSERSSRLQTDKFALISQVWNRFINNCITCYKPGENLTVDEQLFATKVRCAFIQYMSNKPDKFGIKFWLCVDKKSKYLLNAAPYLGRDETRLENQSLGEHVVMSLIEPFVNKGRNVTTDNFFTSVSLANNLLSKRTTLVGTVNKGRRDIPPYVKNLRLNLYETKVLKTDDEQCSLTIYQAKRSKNVLILSTLHDSIQVDESSAKKKPVSVTFYNSTKYGVDVVDQMARKYSVKAASRRWPVQVFYNILDLAAINAWVLYQEVTNKPVCRRNFILQLALELSNISDESDASAPIQPPIPTESSTVGTRKRRHCSSSGCKNKSNKVCDICKKPLCGQCNQSKTFICHICK